MFVLIDFLARQFAAQDLGENVVGIVGGHRRSRISLVWRLAIAGLSCGSLIGNCETKATLAF